MEYLYGFVIAAIVSGGASLVGFDKERGFYSVVLCVIASYYVLFAAIGASGEAMVSELLAAAVFVLFAILGFKRSPWWLVFGLVGHAVFDLLHPRLISNDGVPPWWPGFCFAYDLTAALYLTLLLKVRHSRNAAQ